MSAGIARASAIDPSARTTSSYDLGGMPIAQRREQCRRGRGVLQRAQRRSRGALHGRVLRRAWPR